MAQYFKVLGNYTNLLSKKLMAHLQQYYYFSHRNDLKSVVFAAILEYPIGRYLISLKKTQTFCSNSVLLAKANLQKMV